MWISGNGESRGPLLEGQLWKTPSILSYPLIIKDRLYLTCTLVDRFFLVCVSVHLLVRCWIRWHVSSIRQWLVGDWWLHPMKMCKSIPEFLNSIQWCSSANFYSQNWMGSSSAHRTFTQKARLRERYVGRLSPAASTSEGGPGSHLGISCGRWRVLAFSIYIYTYMGLSENSVPLWLMKLMIIIPTKWLFHWEYTLFSDIPIYTYVYRYILYVCISKCANKHISSWLQWSSSSKMVSFSIEVVIWGTAIRPCSNRPFFGTVAEICWDVDRWPISDGCWDPMANRYTMYIYLCIYIYVYIYTMYIYI